VLSCFGFARVGWLCISVCCLGRGVAVRIAGLKTFTNEEDEDRAVRTYLSTYWIAHWGNWCFHVGFWLGRLAIGVFSVFRFPVRCWLLCSHVREAWPCCPSLSFSIEVRAGSGCLLFKWMPVQVDAWGLPLSGHSLHMLFFCAARGMCWGMWAFRSVRIWGSADQRGGAQQINIGAMYGWQIQGGWCGGNGKWGGRGGSRASTAQQS